MEGWDFIRVVRRGRAGLATKKINILLITKSNETSLKY
jgi:hypothetical protein